MKKQKKPNGYWKKYDNVKKELLHVIKTLKKFPSKADLVTIERGDLDRGITRHKGYKWWRKELGHDDYQKSIQWIDERIKTTLDTFINEIGHFPSSSDFKTHKKDGLLSAIQRYYGGLMKVRDDLGYEIYRKPSGYWTKDMIITEIRDVIKKIGHFPTFKDLRTLGMNGVNSAILKYTNGFKALRREMGYPIIMRRNYWNEKVVKKELDMVIHKLGYFPTANDLRRMGRNDLESQMYKHGGLVKFRELYGYDPLRKPDGYYTIDVIKKEILRIITEIGHFPTWKELYSMGERTLGGSITKKIGFPKLREVMGLQSSSDAKSEKASYSTRKGNNAERFIVPFIADRLRSEGFNVELNKRLAKGRELEIVATNIDEGYVMGIDVTTARTVVGVNSKWNPRRRNTKGYQHYVDKLIVIVIANNHSRVQFKKWNEECPENVSVISYKDIERYFDFAITEKNKRKLRLFARCTFYNKEEIKREWQHPVNTLEQWLT